MARVWWLVGVCSWMLIVGCGAQPHDPDDATECSDGETRCVGLEWQACQSGAFVATQTCESACIAATGCAACDPDHPRPEICNQQDDDCDGKIDEGDNGCGGACPLDRVLGTACDGADADTCLDDQVVCDGPNATACSAGADNVELCNGEDDDCDGQIDEGNNGCGGACDLIAAPGTACDDSDTDLCLDDHYVCAGPNAVVCQGTGDAIEICDGHNDEDCDGQVDEGCSCVNGTTIPCGIAIGQCTVGTETCIDGHFTACTGVAPAPEQCDGEDNDCDGVIDNGDNACGGICPLAIAPGTACDGPDADLCVDDAYVCAGRNDTVCSTGIDNADTCDGTDNDCDGKIDEGGNACGGACPLAFAPGTSCDGADSDLCLDDVIACDGPNAVMCTLGSDNVEVCNGIDDDCDGTIDQGNNACGGACPLAAQPGAACDGPDADLCLDDSYGCDGLNAVVCSTGADNPELCNGSDDDCDGTIDEGSNACGGACPLAAQPGAACDGPDADLCLDDSYSCDGRNAVVCSTGADNPELCNGSDDDCDGTIDEGSNACGGACALAFSPGDPCDGPDADTCNDDSYVCQGLNDTVCSTGSSNVEICDGIDNDCDGLVDNTGTPCCSGHGAAKADGSCTCDAGYTGAQCGETTVCHDAIVIPPGTASHGGVINGTTTGASDLQTASCGTATGGEVVYSLTPTTTGIVTVSSDRAGTAFDTILSVRTGCDQVASEVACNDNYANSHAQVSWLATAGTTYYIIVDGALATAGSYSLVFTVCGDGFHDTDEQCDDGNTDGSDGCSNTCAVAGTIAFSKLIDPAYSQMSINEFGPGGGYHCGDPVGYTCSGFRPSRTDSALAFCDCLDNVADAANKFVAGDEGQCPQDVVPDFWTSGGGRYRVATTSELSANYAGGIHLSTSMASGDFAWSCNHKTSQGGLEYGVRTLYSDGTLPPGDGQIYCGYPSYSQHYTACVDTSGTGAGLCGTRCGLR